MLITRRETLGVLGAAALAAQNTPPIDPELIRRHDTNLDRLLASQVTDAASPWCGAIPDAYGLYHPASISGLANSAIAAYLCPNSKHRGSNELVARLKLGLKYLERKQSPDGNIDLLVTNFNSPPDTGFAVLNAAQAASVASRYQARELVGLLEPFLRRAGAGLAQGGVHTPNHRWVVSAALARIDALFADPRYRRRIDQWLAEGVDIDSDGQYTERSTTIYDSVCNEAFVLMGHLLNKPELFEPVRQDLTALTYLIHPDGELVTEISRRQDQYQRGDMARHWFPLQYMALKDGNGVFAGLAAHYGRTHASLPALMDFPELTRPLPAAQPVPDHYEKRLEYAVRIRRGLTSATILPHDARFFTLRRGPVIVEAVRFASAFFGKGQFRGDSIEGKYRLQQALEAGYYQPLDPPRRVAAGEMSRAGRRQTEVCKIRQSATITEYEKGFRLRLQADGTRDVPLAVEIALRPGGKLTGCEKLSTDTWLLSRGQASYSVEGHTIRFGPGAAPHRYVDVRGALPRVPGDTVYLTGLTPFDHTLEFECD